MPQWQSCYGSCGSSNCSSYGRLQAPKVLRQRKLPQQYESLCSKRFCGSNSGSNHYFFFPLSGFSPSGHRSSCSHGESRTQWNNYSPRFLGGGLKKRVPENQKTSRKSQKGRSLGKQTVKLFKTSKLITKLQHVWIQSQMASQRLWDLAKIKATAMFQTGKWGHRHRIGPQNSTKGSNVENTLIQTCGLNSTRHISYF